MMRVPRRKSNTITRAEQGLGATSAATKTATSGNNPPKGHTP